MSFNKKKKTKKNMWSIIDISDETDCINDPSWHHCCCLKTPFGPSSIVFKNLTMDGYSADIRHYLNVRPLMSYAMNQFLCNCAWPCLEETIREFVWYPLRMKCLKPNQITLKYIINDKLCMLRYGLFYLKLSWMLMNYNNLLSWNGQTYG